MKAVEFVKKFGWDRAKQHIKAMDIQNWHNDFYNNLKRLVDSYDLVESYDGLFEAKIYADSEYRSLSAPQITKRLKQAIADVEGCQ